MVDFSPVSSFSLVLGLDTHNVLAATGGPEQVSAGGWNSLDHCETE